MLSLRKKMSTPPRYFQNVALGCCCLRVYKHKVGYWVNMSKPGMDYNPNDVMKIMIKNLHNVRHPPPSPLISGGGGNHNNNNTAADDAVGQRVMCKHKAPPQLPLLRWPLKAFHRV